MCWCAHTWPGNIRQLRNVLRGMIALRTNDRLDSSSLPADYGLGTGPAEPAAPLTRDGTRCHPLGRAEREALLREFGARARQHQPRRAQARRQPQHPLPEDAPAAHQGADQEAGALSRGWNRSFRARRASAMLSPWDALPDRASLGA